MVMYFAKHLKERSTMSLLDVFNMKALFVSLLLLLTVYNVLRLFVMRLVQWAQSSAPLSNLVKNCILVCQTVCNRTIKMNLYKTELFISGDEKQPVRL